MYTLYISFSGHKAAGAENTAGALLSGAPSRHLCHIHSSLGNAAPGGQVVDIEMGLLVQADIAAGLAVADVVHLHQLRDICRVCTDLGKGQGHPDGPEECPECLDTLQRRALGIVEVHLAAENPDGHLGQTLFAAVLRAVFARAS